MVRQVYEADEDRTSATATGAAAAGAPEDREAVSGSTSPSVRGIAGRRFLVVLLASAGLSMAWPAMSASSASAAVVASVAGRLVATGSVGQVYVTGAPPGRVLVLRDGSGRVVGHRTVDPQGGVLFRGVAPGDGYWVQVQGDGAVRSAGVHVRSATEVPPDSLYRSQQVGAGYGYVTTRDGTQLAVNVQLPGPVDQGPYPTVVEYSGYAVADPGSSQPASRLAQALGYATVGVNIRGTGCSGGAWSYFEPLQSLDGYDVIETIAAQPWVLHGTVGMVGISYSGITQLFVAATRPPHLAAITPLSVIDDTYRGVLYPGGILNTGFAVPWAKDRQSDARPAPQGGQTWARQRVKHGDATCLANQALHAETGNVLKEIRNDRLETPQLDAVSPDHFVDQIAAPTFVAGTWQDEQTGGHWPDLLTHLAPGTIVRATLTNGTHAEPFLPAIITRWAEFLDFYVAQRVPHIPDTARVLAALIFRRFGDPSLALPPDRFAGQSDFAAALAQYQGEPPIRVLFDNGAGGAPGSPIPGFEMDFSQWPAPSLAPTAWYLGSAGMLASPPPTGSGIDQFLYNPASQPRTTTALPEKNLFAASQAYSWKPLPNGTSLAYLSAPLTTNMVMLGPGSVDLWLRSSAADVDLEVTLSEVRPDGKETYVQSGWLRASQRALDPAASTVLEPVQTHTQADVAPLPAGKFSLVRIPIFPFGHAFRAGSRIRISVQAPGGNRPLWAFDALPAHGRVTTEVAYSNVQPSRVVLPVLNGASVPTPLPACPALRGQPCRTYVAPKQK